MDFNDRSAQERGDEVYGIDVTCVKRGTQVC